MQSSSPTNHRTPSGPLTTPFTSPVSRPCLALRAQSLGSAMGQFSDSCDSQASLLEGARQAWSLCRGCSENIPFAAGWMWGRTRGDLLPPIPQSLSSWLCRSLAREPHSTSLVFEKVEPGQEQQSPGQEEIPRHWGTAHTLPRLSSGQRGQGQPGRKRQCPRGSPHPHPAQELFQGVLPWRGLGVFHRGRIPCSPPLLPSLGHRGSWKSAVTSKGRCWWQGRAVPAPRAVLDFGDDV